MSLTVKDVPEDSGRALDSSVNVSPTRDDRILRETRWLSGFIIPFLVAAFYILYLRTSETKELFAWEIAAPMTSMMLASAYMGGAYFFARATFGKRWHSIGLGFLPVVTFASILCIVTLLHLNSFNQGHISFYTWALLYFTTPFLVLLTWFRNRRTDPATLDERDLKLSQIVQYILGAAAIFNLLVSVFLLIKPDLMIGIWPWSLTPLTARVVSSMFGLQGMFGLCVALDGRWSSARIIMESELITLLFILIAIVRTWDTFDQSRPFTWLFVGSITLIVIMLPILYLYVEQRIKRMPR